MKYTAQISVKEKENPIWREISRSVEGANIFSALGALLNVFLGGDSHAEPAMPIMVSAKEEGVFEVDYKVTTKKKTPYVFILNDRYEERFDAEYLMIVETSEDFTLVIRDLREVAE